MNQQHHLQQNLNVVSTGAGDSGMIVMDGMQAVSNDGTMQLLIGLNDDYHQQSQYQDQNTVLCAPSNVNNMLMNSNYDNLVSNIGNDYIYQLPSFESHSNNSSNGLYDINWGVNSAQQSQDAQQQQTQMIWTNQNYIVQPHSEPQIQQQSGQIYITTNHPQGPMVSTSNGHHQIIDSYQQLQQAPQGYNLVPSQLQQTIQTPPPIPTPPASSPSSVSAQPPNKSRGGKRAGRGSASKGENKIQKPVSAYALFFRDTQASIKAENPNACFGDISKIVASKWEGLHKSEKDIYKGRADVEKKNYMATVASTKAKELAEQNVSMTESSFQSSDTPSINQVDYRSQESSLKPQQQTQSQQVILSSHSNAESLMGSPYVSESSNQMAYMNSYHHSQHQQIPNHHQQQQLPQPASPFSHTSMNPVMSQAYQDQFCNENGSNSSSVVSSSSNNEIRVNSNCPSTVDQLDPLDIFDSNNLMDLNLDLDEENITNLFGGSGGILSPTSGLDALDTNDYLNNLNSFANGLHDFTDSSLNANAFLDTNYNSNNVPNTNNSVPLTPSTSNFTEEIKELKQTSDDIVLGVSNDNKKIGSIIDVSIVPGTVQETNLDPRTKNNTSPSDRASAKKPKVVLKIKLSGTKKTANSSNISNQILKTEEKICLRPQCNNKAIESNQWEDRQFCSEECCVRYCSEVFQNWTQEAKLKNGITNELNQTEKLDIDSITSLSIAVSNSERVSTLDTNFIRSTS